MSRSESATQRSSWLGLGGICRLFRLNVGKGWISALGPKGVHRLKDGSVHIEAARPIALGYALSSGEPVVGASDLNGWTTIKITPEMVGRDMAVYTSFEAKKEGGGTVSAAQKQWINNVRKSGGIAGVIRSAADGFAIISTFKASNLDEL